MSVLVRSRLWAWLVYALSPEVTSWDKLDARWLTTIDGNTPTEKDVVDMRGRRRVFYRFFRHGADPKSTRGINGRYLLEEVHKSPGMSEAMRLYESPLWDLVRDNAPTVVELEKHEGELIRRLGLGSFSQLEARVAREVGLEHPGCSTDLDSLRFHTNEIARTGSVDAMALMGVRFRLAIERFSLLEADVYLDSLRWTIEHFHNRWCCVGEVSGPLRALLEVRLLRRAVGGDWESLLGFSRYPWRADQGEPFHWSKEPLILSLPPDVAPPPVPLDQEMVEFRQNFSTNQRKARDSFLAKMAAARAGEAVTGEPDLELAKADLGLANLMAGLSGD